MKTPKTCYSPKTLSLTSKRRRIKERIGGTEFGLELERSLTTTKVVLRKQPNPIP